MNVAIETRLPRPYWSEACHLEILFSKIFKGDCILLNYRLNF